MYNLKTSETLDILTQTVTLKDYDYLLKFVYETTLEEFRSFLLDEADFWGNRINAYPCFNQLVVLKQKLRDETVKKDLHYPCSSYCDLRDCFPLDEEIIFKNIMSFYGSVTYYQNKFYKKPWKMWYHILNSLPVGPHACPFYLNEKLDNTCRGCTCNSISNVCTHSKGKNLEMSFWIRELRNLVGLVYEEAYDKS